MKAMAAAARDEADALKARLDAVEAKLHETRAPTSFDPPAAS